MANTTSAKKATRKIARRTIINKSRRTQMRGAVRIVEEAIKSGDRDAALKAMTRAEPELMQAAQRNIIHKNNARIKSPSSRNKITDRKKYSSESPARCRAFSFSSSYCPAGFSVRNSCGPAFSATEYFPM